MLAAYDGVANGALNAGFVAYNYPIYTGPAASGSPIAGQPATTPAAIVHSNQTSAAKATNVSPAQPIVVAVGPLAPGEVWYAAVHNWWVPSPSAASRPATTTAAIVHTNQTSAAKATEVSPARPIVVAVGPLAPGEVWYAAVRNWWVQSPKAG